MSGGVCTTSAGIAPRDLKANVVHLPPGVRPVVQQTNKSVGLATEARPLSSNRSAECRRGG